MRKRRKEKKKIRLTLSERAYRMLGNAKLPHSQMEITLTLTDRAYRILKERKKVHGLANPDTALDDLLKMNNKKMFKCVRCGRTFEPEGFVSEGTFYSLCEKCSGNKMERK